MHPERNNSGLHYFVNAKFIIFSIVVFNLAWMLLHVPETRFWDYVSPIADWQYHEVLIVSSFLIIASLGLILNRVWSLVTAVILSGFSAYNRLIFDFLLMSRNAEVPMFSHSHFNLWWMDLYEGQLLQVAIASIVLWWAVVSVIRHVVAKYPRCLTKGLR